MDIKEATEIMKQFIEDTPKLPYDCIANHEIEAVETILNELTRKKKYIYNAVTDTITEIPTNGEYIHKDKIKEKIELLKDILKAKEKDGNIYKQIPIEYLKGAIEQLEELLEEK